MTMVRERLVALALLAACSLPANDGLQVGGDTDVGTGVSSLGSSTGSDVTGAWTTWTPVSSTGGADSGELGDSTGVDQPGDGPTIVFPPSGATASPTIVVRGTTPHGGDVTGVTVGGVAAISDDGFATWHAEVPLALGDNALAASIQAGGSDVLGTQTVIITRFPDDAGVLRGTGFEWTATNLRGMDVDPISGAVHSADTNYDGVLRIDLASGDRDWATCSESTPACEGQGEGAEMSDPGDLAFVSERGQALVPDGGMVVAVDVATKGRAIVSGAGLGTGPAMARAARIAYDPTDDRAIVLDWDAAQVLSIDLATGNRTLVASANQGSGVAVDSFVHIEGDFARGRAVLTRAYSNDLYVLDLTTGDRDVLDGAGAPLVEPSGIVMDPASDTLFVTSAGEIVAVDLANGMRRVVASGEMGSGPALDEIRALAFAGELLFARINGAMLAIDPLAGHRVYLSK